MSDAIFILATVVFFAICALYVHWCDKIIGPDEFAAADGELDETPDEATPMLLSAVSGTSRDVTP